MSMSMSMSCTSLTVLVYFMVFCTITLLITLFLILIFEHIFYFGTLFFVDFKHFWIVMQVYFIMTIIRATQLLLAISSSIIKCLLLILKDSLCEIFRKGTVSTPNNVAVLSGNPSKLILCQPSLARRLQLYISISSSRHTKFIYFGKFILIKINVIAMASKCK